MVCSFHTLTGTPACICMSPTEPALVGVSSAVIGSSKHLALTVRDGAHMKMHFAGAEAVFIFCSSLINGSCARKEADNPAEMTCVP